MIGLLDIGGTKLLAAVAMGSGAPLPTLRRPTPPEHALETLTEMLDSVRDGIALEAIGIAVPGPFDREAGALVNPPNLPESWHGLPLAAALRERYGCPVVVENDANCAGVAEARSGAAVGRRTVVYYTVSTGIGTGIVRDGLPLLGRHDSEGGHQVLWPPHLGAPSCHCGGAGCLEALASGRAIEARFGRRAEELDAQAAWDEIGTWLGLGVVNAVALHDPDAVVLGGGVCAAWERFWPALTTTVDRSLHLQPRPLVARAELGDDRNLRGAQMLALATPPGRSR